MYIVYVYIAILYLCVFVPLRSMYAGLAFRVTMSLTKIDNNNILMSVCTENCPQATGNFHYFFVD